MYDSIKKQPRKGENSALFSGLLEARDSLVSHWHVTSHSASDIWNPTSEKISAVPEAGAWQKKSRSILARWSSAYDAYLNIRGDNLTDMKRKGTAVLCILKELGSTAMMLTRTMVDDERDWDVFCPMFRKIVALADDIVELDLKSTAGRPTYCIDMALIGPLFEVSSLSSIFSPVRRSRELYQVKSHSEEVLTLPLSRSPVAAEILSFAGKRYQFFENAVAQKEYGMLFQLPKSLKEF